MLLPLLFLLRNLEPLSRMCEEHKKKTKALFIMWKKLTCFPPLKSTTTTLV